MNQQLFRPEVMQARQATWLGGIRIGHHPRFSVVAGVALLLAGCLVTFAVWGQVARKARIPGVLMPANGTVQLSANAPGVLTDLRVQEGERVVAGQTLFVLDTDRPTAEGAASVLLGAHLTLRRDQMLAEGSARQDQAQQRDMALRDRIRALNREIAQAEQEAVLANRRVALAQKTLGRYQQMAQEGFVSDIQAQSKQEELIDLQARVESTQRNAANLQREQQTLQAERQANQRQLNIDLAQLDRALVSLDQESTENQARKTIVIIAHEAGVISNIHLPRGAAVQAGHSRCGGGYADHPLAQESTELDARHLLHLVAPSPAIVGAVSVHPGQSLQSGQTVLSLIPLTHPASGSRPRIAAGFESLPIQEEALPLQAEHFQTQRFGAAPLQAQLYAPSRTAGFIEPGQAVWLRLHAFPYQKFGMVPGQVTEVSRTPVLPQDLPSGMANALMSAAQSQEPLYRITVALQRDSLQAFGKAQPLKAGMSLEADVIQDRRAIWEWVLEPLLAAKARWRIPSNEPSNTSPGGV